MIIEQEMLSSATGYARPADIARCLRKQGIRVFTGKDGRVFCFERDFDRKRKKEPNLAALAPQCQG